MDQDTRWLTRYNEVKTFIEKNHRNPSKILSRRKVDGAIPYYHSDFEGCEE